MRGYKTLIQEAELLAMSPEAVSVLLRNRARQSKGKQRNDWIDEEAEAALLARSSPLIDLSLARYARHTATLVPIFQRSQPSSALRFAVLTNETVGSSFFPDFPVSLFASPAQAAAWIGEAPNDELHALFENPTLNDGFLRSLLERSNSWGGIGEERLAIIVAILASNERMRTPYEDKYMDGHADYVYSAVFDAAWRLAGTVEPSRRWAVTLRSLYDWLIPDAFSIKEPLILAKRWQSEAANAELDKDEAEENERGWLSDYQGVRMGLARLALSNNSKLLPELLASDDPALRSAAYASAQFTAAELLAAYQRDGELVFNQAMHNPRIWRTSESRDALREIAWSVVRNDKLSDLTAANVYNHIHDDMAEKHPDWFKDELDASEELLTKTDIADLAARMAELAESEEPATKTDIADLAASMAELAESERRATKAAIAELAARMGQSDPTHGHLIEELQQALRTLNSRVGWLWWLSLGALLAAGYKRL